ncbi:MAG: glycerate kinase type-2 family protein [Acidobacteriaceae bacterium]
MANLRDIARTIFDRALKDCSVEQAIARHVSVRDGTLHMGEEAIDLGGIQRVRVVAVGKAAGTMLLSLLHQLTLPAPCDLAGVLIAPEGPPPLSSQLPNGFQVFAGGHPTPNGASFVGARAALTMLKALPQDTPENTLCFFLISGGASAMMELPLDPTITLADTASFHRALVGSGASIAEINCVRKHFSAVKGGRLAMAAGAAMCRSLLISDVPIGREDALGSGPTVPDSSTVAECSEILERYHLLTQFPAAVQHFFESEAMVETPKPEELHARASVLLSAQALADAAAKHAEAIGYIALIDNSCDEWDYKTAAKYLLDRLRSFRTEHPNVCLISAGELRVTLPSSSSAPAAIGTGGRNQQFALYAATLLHPEDDPIAILSAGSDGIDGNSPAAGAVIDHNSLKDAESRAIARVLEGFDAYPFLRDRKVTIIIGPSGNNLRDLRILIAATPQASMLATVARDIP